MIDFLEECLTSGRKSLIVTWLAVQEVQALFFAYWVILKSFLLKLLSREDYYLLTLGLDGDTITTFVTL